MNFQNFVSKATVAVTKITAPNIEKDYDPRYHEAKEKFLRLNLNFDKMVKLIKTFESNLEKLSKASLKLSSNMVEWLNDGSYEQQIKAKTALSFSKHFSALTINFLQPRVEPHVIALLSKYQDEINRLKEVRSQIKKTRKEYLKSISALEKLKANPTTDQMTIEEAQLTVKKNKEEYEKLNKDFVASVRKLDESKEQSLEVPFKNLLCLMSQYMMQVFKELQRFRTTFPPQTFRPDNV